MIKALQRHLRRSLSLRSLKFFHGLPQVSSRMARKSVDCADSARPAALREESSSGQVE
jgi:hypothetical protein